MEKQLAAGKAIENFSCTIELDPQLVSAYSYRAEAYRLKSMTPSVIRNATTDIRLQGDRRSIASVYAKLSKIYRKAGQNELSEVNLKKSIELNLYLADYPPQHFPLMCPYFGGTSSLKPVNRLGLFGVISLIFVVIFKFTLPAPTKKNGVDSRI